MNLKSIRLNALRIFAFLFPSVTIVMSPLNADVVENTLATSGDTVAWQIETVVPASPTSPLPFGSIVLDGQGEPHVIFKQNSELSRNNGNIFHAFRNGEAWQTERITAYSEMGGRPAAVFDDIGRLHMVYADSGRLWYGLLTDDSWQQEQIITPGISVSEAYLSVDGDGFPHVAFNNNTTTGVGYYASLDGSNWAVETIATSFTPFSVATNDQGQPVVAGFGGGNLRVATRGLLGWSIETVGRGGLGASLALDEAGIPHIGHAVINDDDLRYATKSGDSWTNDVVIPLGPGASGPSLALGKSGLPQMTFERRVNGNNHVMHAFYNGTQWTTGVVDPAISTALRTSLAVGEDGVSHVIYTIQNGDLRYARGVIVPEPSACLLAALASVGCCLLVFRKRSTRLL